MNTENTDNGGTQQTNSGADAGAANQAANPEANPSTATGTAEGQGNGGDNAGGTAGNAGEQGDKGTGDGQKPEAQGAPESYEPFNVPEGYTLEGPRLELAQEKFKAWGFDQTRAQEAIEAFVQADKENSTIMQQAAEQATAQKREVWAQQSKEQLGDKFDAEVAYAKTALASLNNPKLVEAFETEGWGNHPELIKVFAHLGRISRDSAVDGIGSPGGTQQAVDIAKRMYPNG